MTVKQLIAALKKMPQTAKVVFVAHDQNPDAGEFDGVVHWASDAPEALKERGYGVMLHD